MMMLFWVAVMILSMAGLVFAAVWLWSTKRGQPRGSENKTACEEALKKIRLAQDLARIDLYTFMAQEMILEALVEALPTMEKQDKPP